VRNKESVERIATLVSLKVVRRGEHARGPRVKGVVAGEGLGELPRSIDRQRLGWLTWPNHTRAQTKNPASDIRCGLM
jgi:hypothetical protein